MTAEAASEPARLPWSPLLPWQAGVAHSMLERRASFPHALLIHGAGYLACLREPRCGDGFLDSGEECDDGNDTDLDG
mgnify:CR=1 FL=1